MDMPLTSPPHNLKKVTPASKSKFDPRTWRDYFFRSQPFAGAPAIKIETGSPDFPGEQAYQTNTRQILLSIFSRYLMNQIIQCHRQTPDSTVAAAHITAGLGRLSRSHVNFESEDKAEEQEESTPFLQSSPPKKQKMGRSQATNHLSFHPGMKFANAINQRG